MANMLSLDDWKSQPTSLRNMLFQSNMEEAMLEFFYDGVCPMIKQVGYRWLKEDKVIAAKFVRLCYDIACTVEMGDQFTLTAPKPLHRNDPEDLNTFHMFLDTQVFLSLMKEWSFRSEIVGTRLDYKIEEFCYTWVDVEYGKPGKWTRELLDDDSDEMNPDDKFASIDIGTFRNENELY